MLDFHKYQGTGNDFILLDNRTGNIRLSTDEIALFCDRRFGIGADGLMLLEQVDGFDFRMVYFNADGRESTMCGNGGRCMAAFARSLGIVSAKARFLAIDGLHLASLDEDTVSLQMKDVSGIEFQDGYTIMDTGSPHYVTFVADTQSVHVNREGREIRNLPRFLPGGINVNFVQTSVNRLQVRTYERGVESETLSCGTGVVASAIAATRQSTGIFALDIDTPGGRLVVTFDKYKPDAAREVVLTGPATFVFRGTI